MCQSNQSLLSRLEDVQVRRECWRMLTQNLQRDSYTHNIPPSTVCVFKSKLTKLNHEHRDLKEKLKEERKQTEELWKTKAQLEDERRLQDRAVEQLQRKVSAFPVPGGTFRSRL